VKFTLHELLSACRFLDRRHDFAEWIDLYEAKAVVAEVARLRRDDSDLPAVIFHAVARRPEGMGDAWRKLPPVLARNYAAKVGFTLVALDEELNSLVFRVATREVTLDELRAWFRERMKPLP
jgi:hypothetical protein